MTALTISFCLVAAILLIASFRIRPLRVKRALRVLAGIVIGFLLTTIALQQPRSQAISFGVFFGLLALFRLAGQFKKP